MTLEEIFQHLLDEGSPFHRNQVELGRRLGISQQKISLLRRDAPVMEKNFQLFLAVVKLCRDLGVDLLSDKPNLSLINKPDAEQDREWKALPSAEKARLLKYAKSHAGGS